MIFGFGSKKKLTPMGNAVADLRNKKKKGHYKMCKHLGVHPDVATDIERGRRPIPPDYAEQLIQFFELTGEEALKFRKIVEDQRKKQS